MHFKITAHIHTNYILYTWNSDERFTFSLNVTSLFIGMIIIYSSHSTQVAYTYSMLISCLEAPAEITKTGFCLLSLTRPRIAKCLFVSQAHRSNNPDGFPLLGTLKLID